MRATSLTTWGDVKDVHVDTHTYTAVGVSVALIAGNKLTFHPSEPPVEFYCCLLDCHLHSSIYGGKLGFCTSCSFRQRCSRD